MPRARIAGVLLVVVVACAGLGWLATTDDARLFALATDTGQVRWSVALPYGTRMVGNPAVAAGRVVVSTAGPPPLVGGDDRWALTTYDTRSGRLLWQYEPPREHRDRIDAVVLALTRPYLTEDRVFVRLESGDGATLLALDAATGQQAWTADRLAFGRSSRHTDLAVSGDRVLVPIQNGDRLEIQALRESDGVALWSASLDGEVLPDSDLGPLLAASPDTFYVGLTNGIVAFDAATGAERFRIPTLPAVNGGQIALADRLLYRRTGLQTVVAYDAATGQERWSYQPPFDEAWRGALRSFAVRDRLLAIYCACDEGRENQRGWLLAVDADSGQERWRATLDAYLDLYQDLPTIGGGVVLAGSENDDVVARVMTDGTERWRFPRERGMLVATDGRLVYATDRAPRWRHWLASVGWSR